MENLEEKEVLQEENVDVEEKNDIPEDGDAPVSLNQYRKFMSLMCYLSGLLLIPLICMFRDPVVRKHASNGLVLLIIELVLVVAAEIFSAFELTIAVLIIYVLLLFPLIFSIIGIVFVAKDMHKEVPLIGKMKILK